MRAARWRAAAAAARQMCGCGGGARLCLMARSRCAAASLLSPIPPSIFPLALLPHPRPLPQLYKPLPPTLQAPSSSAPRWSIATARPRRRARRSTGRRWCRCRRRTTTGRCRSTAAPSPRRPATACSTTSRAPTAPAARSRCRGRSRASSRRAATSPSAPTAATPSRRRPAGAVSVVLWRAGLCVRAATGSGLRYIHWEQSQHHEQQQG